MITTERRVDNTWHSLLHWQQKNQSLFSVVESRQPFVVWDHTQCHSGTELSLKTNLSPLVSQIINQMQLVLVRPRDGDTATAVVLHCYCSSPASVIISVIVRSKSSSPRPVSSSETIEHITSRRKSAVHQLIAIACLLHDYHESK